MKKVINFKLVVSIIILCGVMLLAGCGTSNQAGTGVDITSAKTGTGRIKMDVPQPPPPPIITYSFSTHKVTVTDPSGNNYDRFYTINGDIPTSTSTPTNILYSIPFTVSPGTTIKARIYAGTKFSAVATYTVTVIEPIAMAVPVPTFAYAPGPPTGKAISTMALRTKYVQISSETPGAEIRYRLIDSPGTGAVPSKTTGMSISGVPKLFVGTTYTVPISVVNGQKIEAYVRRSDGLTSPPVDFFVQDLPSPEFIGSLTSSTNAAPYTLTVNVSSFADQPTGTEILYKYASIQETSDFVKPYCVSTTDPNIVIPGITYTPAYVRLRFYDANQTPSNGPIASDQFSFTPTTTTTLPATTDSVPAPTITYSNFVWGAGGTNQLTLTVTKPANGRIQYTYGASASIPDPISSYTEFTPYDSATTATIVRPNISYNTIYLKLRAQIPDPQGTSTPISSTIVPVNYSCSSTGGGTGIEPTETHGPKVGNKYNGYYSFVTVYFPSAGYLRWGLGVDSFPYYGYDDGLKAPLTSHKFQVGWGFDRYFYVHIDGPPQTQSHIWRYYNGTWTQQTF